MCRHEPVKASRDMLRAMPSTEVVVQTWPAPLAPRYFRNVMPEIPVAHCASCLHFFDGDNFASAVLKAGACPFCRAKVSINGDLETRPAPAATTTVGGVPTSTSAA